jgi:hypothetical protein
MTPAPRGAARGASANTMNRSRAERHAVKETISPPVARRTGRCGSGGRWRGRAPPRGVTLSPRTSSGSHRSSPASYSTANSDGDVHSHAMACLQNSRTAATTAFTRTGPRLPLCCNQNMNDVNRRAPDHQSRFSCRHHRKNNIRALAYDFVVPSLLPWQAADDVGSLRPPRLPSGLRRAPFNTAAPTATAPGMPASEQPRRGRYGATDKLNHHTPTGHVAHNPIRGRSTTMPTSTGPRQKSPSRGGAQCCSPATCPAEAVQLVR